MAGIAALSQHGPHLLPQRIRGRPRSERRPRTASATSCRTKSLTGRTHGSPVTRYQNSSGESSPEDRLSCPHKPCDVLIGHARLLAALAARTAPLRPPHPQCARRMTATGGPWYPRRCGGATTARSPPWAGWLRRRRQNERSTPAGHGADSRLRRHPQPQPPQHPRAPRRRRTSFRQGVTTVVEGNDGGSPLPLSRHSRRGAQGASPAVNYASFVGHGSIRSEVIGSVDRKATDDEIRQMQAIARRAMQDGAWGVSSGPVLSARHVRLY